MKFILFALISFLSFSVNAQTSCVCTGSGCKIASDPYPTSAGQPVTCTVYKAGVALASAPAVQSSSLPANNSAMCQPSSTYPTSPAGSVSCLVPIPAQSLGNVTLTMTATNAAGESAHSAPFVFTNVAALVTVPSSPVIRGPWLP